MSTQSDVQKREVENVETVERTRSTRTFVPAVDIYETKDAIMLMAEMPGVDEKSVDVSLDKNVLTISGNVEPTTVDGFDLVYQEYEDGDFQRSFTLSNEIDIDKIEASVKNGVLSLALPKIERVRSKKIEVKLG
jgi:HSP20 family molecular chaperone IbpA